MPFGPTKRLQAPGSVTKMRQSPSPSLIGNAELVPGSNWRAPGIQALSPLERRQVGRKLEK
jgi:hypothetical protein